MEESKDKSVEKSKVKPLDSSPFRKEIEIKSNKKDGEINVYKIINELSSTDYSRTFTAKKKVKEELSDKNYLVKFYDKDYLVKNILNGDKNKKDEFEIQLIKYYEKGEKEKEGNIQMLLGFTKDEEEGYYYILEYCDYTLDEFISRALVSQRNNKIEIVVIKFIYNLAKYIHSILSNMDLYEDSKKIVFGSLLNSYDVYIKENKEKSDTQDDYKIKLPNPALSFIDNIYTIKYVSESRNLRGYNYLPPEIFSLINYFANGNKSKSKKEKNKEKKYKLDFNDLKIIFDLMERTEMEYCGKDKDLKDLDKNYIDPLYVDYYSVGYLSYQMLFCQEPFTYIDLKDAIDKSTVENGKEQKYLLYEKEISDEVCKLLKDCLVLNASMRRIINIDKLEELTNLEKSDYEKKLLDQAMNKGDKPREVDPREAN